VNTVKIDAHPHISEIQLTSETIEQIVMKSVGYGKFSDINCTIVTPEGEHHGGLSIIYGTECGVFRYMLSFGFMHTPTTDEAQQIARVKAETEAFWAASAAAE
jgi:hypothetical protein